MLIRLFHTQIVTCAYNSLVLLLVPLILSHGRDFEVTVLLRFLSVFHMLCCFALHAHPFIPSTTSWRRLRWWEAGWPSPPPPQGRHRREKAETFFGKRLLSLVYAKRSAGGDD
ncbi:hypothetical protein EUGRSUZ_E01373 [Eucalyptus grandis]|uniref:Uncharacterized protein n=2 Tax=Eucalyptus grandis TaxID=71139 RepID=A0A059C3D1_EUCGR|nr:hypothetical protein EUGRSUZ_E01373 [Eucalyptus grandis]